MCCRGSFHCNKTHCTCIWHPIIVLVVVIIIFICLCAFSIPNNRCKGSSSNIEFACALFLWLTISGEQFIDIYFFHFVIIICLNALHVENISNNLLLMVDSGHLDNNSFYSGRSLCLFICMTSNSDELEFFSIETETILVN